MTASWIDITAADGGTFRGYLSTPPSGKGPGIVLIQEIFGINSYMRDMADHFAEEGYVCLVPDLFWRMEPGVDLGYDEADFAKAFDFYQEFDVDQGVTDIDAALGALRAHDAQVGKVGCIGYCLGGLMAWLTAARTSVDCAVSYYGVGIEGHLDEADKVTVPTILHIAEADGFVPPEAQEQIIAMAEPKNHIDIYVYPGCDHAFATPGRDSHNKPAELMAYSRSLALYRKEMGPIYDLSTLWDKHCEYEFGTRDVDATMKTMVAEPYVNHIPTMTGGVGHDNLAAFYRDHFVNSNPPDTALIPISRTIGSDRLVDEMLFTFTHTCEIPWMLPGIEPTGKRVEIPLVAIVNFRGDKLYHEHIYWDQASVLVQIGALDPSGLPVAGIATAQKLLDETLPSNELMGG